MANRDNYCLNVFGFCLAVAYWCHYTSIGDKFMGLDDKSRHMATVTIENPERMDAKKVDGSGKVYLGNAWAGKRVRFVIEDVEEIEEDEAE